jgi:type IX secretion system PorP/SprF family membrane protein
MKKAVVIKSIVVALILLKATTGAVNAQYDAMFTQYMFNETFINPAYTGYKDALSVTALQRQQWVGFDGRPVTTIVSIHAPVFRNTMGVGLSFLTEKIGVTTRTLLYASYAYRVKVSSKARLSFGLMGGVHIRNEKLTSLSLTDQGDPNFSSNLKNVITPNFGFGILYTTDKFYAGLSIPRLIDDELSVTADGLSVQNLGFRLKKFHYYLTVGRIFTVSENLKLKPQLLVKAVYNAPIEFDLNLNALIKDRLWLGASYRSGADMSLIAGVQILPQFLFSYSYDFSLTKIKKFNSGSHEIALNYLFSFKGKKISNPRYF